MVVITSDVDTDDPPS